MPFSTSLAVSAQADREETNRRMWIVRSCFGLPLFGLCLVTVLLNATMSSGSDEPPPAAKRAEPQTPEDVAASYLASKLRQTKSQMESVEFLWTPGELVRQSITPDSIPCYPDH